MRMCRICGKQISLLRKRAIYCSDECSRVAKNRADREYYHKRKSAQVTAVHAPQVPRPVVQRIPVGFVAPSLAETPEVPAVTAQRGDYLTGAAPQARWSAAGDFGKAI